MRKLSEDHKIGVREARRTALATLKDLEGGGSLPADERHRVDKQIQDLTDAHVKEIDDTSAKKEEEILQV